MLQVCKSEMRAGLSSNEPGAISWAFVSQAEIKAPGLLYRRSPCSHCTPGPFVEVSNASPKGSFEIYIGRER